MEPWIAFSLAAAFFQSFRFMLQKQLSGTGLSAVAATFARFAFSAPIIAVAVLIYIQSTGASLDVLGLPFWGYAALGGLAQILATVCMVALFTERNFAVGITLKKSEVLQTAFVGMLILGEAVTLPGLGAMILGTIALIVLSDLPGGVGWRRFFNRASGLGLLSGAFFAVSGVAYRGAILAVPSEDPWLRAGVALSLVTLMQAASLAAWLAWRDRAQLIATFRAWRAGALVGGTSLAGSYCWFAAFGLQTPAYVFAVGQIEVAFSMAIGALVFGESLSRREYSGIALLLISILVLVLVV